MYLVLVKLCFKKKRNVARTGRVYNVNLSLHIFCLYILFIECNRFTKILHSRVSGLVSHRFRTCLYIEFSARGIPCAGMQPVCLFVLACYPSGCMSGTFSVA